MLRVLRSRMFTAALLLLAVAPAVTGCLPSSSSGNQNNSNDQETPSPTPYPVVSTTPTPTFSPTPTPSPAYCNSAYGTTGATTIQASYLTNVQTILSIYCVSCHQPGKTAPDLTSYASAVAAATSSLTWISQGKMPPTMPLPETDMATFQAWVQAGEPENINGTVAGSATESAYGTVASGVSGAAGTTYSAAPTCIPLPSSTLPVGGLYPNNGTMIGSGYSDPTATLNTLVNPPQMSLCQSQGLVYDRAAQACGVGIAVSYQCNQASIHTEFEKFAINIDTQLGTYLSEGYQIDQCGEQNGDPVVYLMKSNIGGSSVSLQTKKLCRSGSTLCN